jgi:DNA-binding protein YbaB
MTKRIRPQKTRSAFAGFGSDFTQTLAEVNRLRDEMNDVRAEIASTTITVTFGPVSATVTGENRVVALELTSDVPADAAALVAAAQEAIAAAQSEIADYAAERLAPYAALADIV